MAVDVSVVDTVDVSVDVAVGKSLPSIDEPLPSIGVPSGRKMIKLPSATLFAMATAPYW